MANIIKLISEVLRPRGLICSLFGDMISLDYLKRNLSHKHILTSVYLSYYNSFNKATGSDILWYNEPGLGKYCFFHTHTQFIYYYGGRWFCRSIDFLITTWGLCVFTSLVLWSFEAVPVSLKDSFKGSLALLQLSTHTHTHTATKGLCWREIKPIFSN